MDKATAITKTIPKKLTGLHKPSCSRTNLGQGTSLRGCSPQQDNGKKKQGRQS